ncbi:serpin family protein [Isachenkonia alkalipeptolytica]|uniref:Serpin family protein n=1 Tax=Isachenkonia alkalipeptolytica TaxID=2565777 RepID=A0AA43XMB4_9CLOT|nr:serpin family protein [Isachenkonia alkalipeptolytica]NBG88565.1 serpin family protein [Isachenkonia alkalipeptolytica]
MKKPVFMGIILLLTAALIGCGTLPGGEAAHDYDQSKVSGGFVEGNNDFAWDIMKALNEEAPQENVFISPISISTALAMTYQGARGETREEMAEVLGYAGIGDEVLQESYEEFLKYLVAMDPDIDLSIANSIWYREGESIEEDFLEVNQQVFNALVEEMDFSDEGAAEEINAWIEEATEGKIEEMLEGPIPGDVIMYLINAIYFQGDWTEPFEEEQSFEGEFTSISGEVQDVMMMKRSGEVAYGEGNSYQSVRMPYGEEENTAMYVIMPREEADINEFLNTLDNEQWQEIKESISLRQNVELQMPRFEMEYGIKSLKDALGRLGMVEAFDMNADFEGIRPGIFIEEVLHKAVIEVNEQGSEAAAATVVVMEESAAMDPPSFIADRPFLFVIANEEADSILFMGKAAGW